MKYAVSIPTYDKAREPTLHRTVEAFLKQTSPPDLILVVDNNDIEHPVELPEDPRVVSIRNDYWVPGIIHGDQTGLRALSLVGYKYVARWDDDLVPRLDCMEKLIACMERTGSVAVGGVYPSKDRPGESRLSEDALDMVGRAELIVPDEHQQHLQFYAWSGEHKYIKRHFLYSSFLYSVQAIQAIGGFCTEYSQHSYRADTDVTLRLGKFAGPLHVVTNAVADHLFGEGGTRSIVGEEKDRMLDHDIHLFGLRMRALGIDPNY